MALYGWTGDNGDPDNFLHVLLGCTAARPGGNNVARWCDADYDALVTRAKRLPTATRSARSSTVRRRRSSTTRRPGCPIAHSIVFMATRRDVTGFVMDPLGRHPFDGVDIKEAERFGEAQCASRRRRSAVPAVASGAQCQIRIGSAMFFRVCNPPSMNCADVFPRTSWCA